MEKKIGTRLNYLIVVDYCLLTFIPVILKDFSYSLNDRFLLLMYDMKSIIVCMCAFESRNSVTGSPAVQRAIGSEEEYK